MHTSLEVSRSLPCNGTVLVTTSLLKASHEFKFPIALPDRIPCVQMPRTSAAPLSLSVSAALTIVPSVSAISSTRIAIFSVEQINSQSSSSTTVSHTSYVPDQNHLADLARFRSFLVDQSEITSQPVSDGGSTLRSSCIWTDDDNFADVEVFSDVAENCWLSVQIVDRHVEKTL